VREAEILGCDGCPTSGASVGPLKSSSRRAWNDRKREGGRASFEGTCQ
jgi:hypothetical protein